MCGLAGIIAHHQNDNKIVQIQKMLQSMRSRGPDSSGFWQDNALVLGHNRLAIHDLSQDGHQPMLSTCGNYCLVFNGEIYNYRHLREQLRQSGCQFIGDSDTEVLLAGLVTWGVSATLDKIDGMFAFAYWDKQSALLTIARDRMGEKPLYYFDDGNTFIFASELKGIVQGTETRLAINPMAVNLFLKHSYIPAPYSIYQKVKKLLPGHYLSVGVNNDQYSVSETQYFDFTQQHHEPNTIDSNLQQLLIESVEQRLDADVPVGAFLSGGIDSSLICAIAKRELNADISAHTIGFHEKDFDESIYATEIAQELNIAHHVHMFSQQDMLNVLPNMVDTYDEPFADASQLATYLLCQKTREHVTVALSGDAGDELYGGYSRYQITLKRWHQIAQVPSGIRKTLGLAANVLEPVLQRGNWLVTQKEKLRRGMQYWSCDNLKQLYGLSTSYDWQADTNEAQLPSQNIVQSSDLRYLMMADSLLYMPDAILTKVDRASMAHSLEVRVPLLANSILAHSASVDTSSLNQNGLGKWPLRDMLYDYIAPSIIERPKRGFAVPLKYWLRQDLKSWAQSLIFDESLQALLPYVDHGKYRRYWQQHQQALFDWSGQLWIYLQLMNWLTTHRKGL